VKVWTLLSRHDDQVYPEDIQDLAKYVLGHRVWLGPHAATHGVAVDAVIDNVVDQVPVP
jgi:MoxR-like ATPase